MSPGGGDGESKNGAPFPPIRQSITPQAYWRSAPLRRLRHPLEEAPIWGILCTLLGEIVTFLIGVPVLALLLPVLVIAKITRVIIHCRQREHSSSDSSEHDPEKVDPSAILHAVLILESSGSSQSLDVTSWRSIVTSRLIQQYPRLRCRPHLLPLGRRCWFEDTCFDINQHVVDERNEEPSAWATPDKLQRYVASLVDTKLPANRPPWEMRLLLRTEDLVAIIRVHKDVADATTLVKFLSHALDDEASTFQAKAINGDFWYSLKNFIRATLVGPFTVLLWFLFTVPEYNVFTDKTKWEGSSSIYWSDAITLPKVSRIKQVTRSTTGCVLISALAGSARLTLQAYGIRNPADMSALIPILVSSPQRSSLPGINEPEYVWSPGILRMPISTEGAVPRLWSTRTNLKDLKQSSDPAVFFLASKVISYITPKSWSLSTRFRNNLKTKASLQFTTAPGLRHRVRILGYNVKSIYVLVPPDPCVGLTVSAFSYHDHIYITILSDKSLSPAAKFLLNNMHIQIEQLWQLLINRRVPGESPPLDRRIDITSSPVKELRLRLSNVQIEVEEELKKCQLSKRESTRAQVNTIVVSTKKDSTCTNLPSDERLEGLRSEFSALLNELYRRGGSLTKNKIDEWDIEDGCLFRPRRRALSCSSSSVHRSLIDKFNSIARPTSCIETSSSTILVSKNSGTSCCFVAPNNLNSPDERVKPFAPTVAICKDNNIKIKDDCSTEDQSEIIEATTDSSYRRSMHEELDYIQLPMEEDEEVANKYEDISQLPETSKADEKVKFWLTKCPPTICETISEKNNLPNNKLNYI